MGPMPLKVRISKNNQILFLCHQTLISSILHKYVNDRFVDKKEVFKISELMKLICWLPLVDIFRTFYFDNMFIIDKINNIKNTITII